MVVHRERSVSEEHPFCIHLSFLNPKILIMHSCCGKCLELKPFHIPLSDVWHSRDSNLAESRSLWFSLKTTSNWKGLHLNQNLVALSY
jgi:hypothetical protein